MFFSSSVFETPSAEVISQKLSSRRLEHGQAMLDWYKQMLKISEIHKETSINRHCIIEQKIISCLRSGPMTTLEIGRNVSRLPITAILHKMASDGVVIHHQERNEHIWELTGNNYIQPIVVPGIL